MLFMPKKYHVSCLLQHNSLFDRHHGACCHGQMSTIGNRIKTFREAKGWSQAQLAAACGWDSQGRVSNYERGVREPKAADLKKLAQALSVSQLELISEQSDSTSFKPDPSKTGLVKVISWVQAGLWGDVVDNYQPGDGEETISTTTPIAQHTYALRVKGDSMEPMFPDGSFIIVEPELSWQNGDYVIVRQNSDSECTFKQIIIDGSKTLLKPVNNRYPILEMLDDALICGVVRGMQLKIR